MRILITGVNGFVGRSLFKQLSDKYTIYGLYHNGIALSEYCYKIDLTNEIETLKLFEKNFKEDIDVIIHAASRMASASNLNDVSVIADNLSMTKNIALASKKVKIKHLINFSSSSVYPNIDGVFNENSEIDPSKNQDCFYGISKYNGEVIFNYLLHDTSIGLIHLRVAQIHGLGMDTTRIFSVLERELAEKNTLTLYGDGERLLNIISIDKLSEYIDLIIQNPIQGVINISEETISVSDLAKRIISVRGNSDSRIILCPNGNRKKFRLDIKKLKSTFNV